jgi:anti-anti-sigma regulatory factor
MIEIPLQSDLGIEHVAELHAVLLPHLDDTEPLALAAGDVGRVHTAGVQLLHAFVRDRAARGCATIITQPSPALARAARDLALAASLGLPSEEDGESE